MTQSVLKLLIFVLFINFINSQCIYDSTNAGCCECLQTLCTTLSNALTCLQNIYCSPYISAFGYNNVDSYNSIYKVGVANCQNVFNDCPSSIGSCDVTTLSTTSSVVSSLPTPSTTSSTISSLPTQNECTNPIKGTCSYYRDCAQAKYNCKPDEYPLGYGEKYCKKFIEIVNQLTPKGQTWVYNTMECLQLSIVNFVQNGQGTCTDLGNLAFQNHVKCYLDNGFCDLENSDKAEIGIADFPSAISNPQQTVTQAINVLGSCAKSLVSSIMNPVSDSDANMNITPSVRNVIILTISKLFILL